MASLHQLIRPMRNALKCTGTAAKVWPVSSCAQQPYSSPPLPRRHCVAFYSSSSSSSSSNPWPSVGSDDVNRSGPIDPTTADELQLGELPGGSFRIEPLRRVGEDATTMRARLLYQSRKRGTLESDLLLSTFAAARLGNMPLAQLEQYDRFLDENDWDIYYWATQTEEEPTAAQIPTYATPKRGPAERPAHEWAQTVGTFKAAYRPVPARWKGSEILALLRKHVRERSAGGDKDKDSKNASTSDHSKAGRGMAFMPPLSHFGDRT